MRVLLEQECTAIAGGHDSECVDYYTTGAVAAGAIAGAIIGAPGAGAGAVVGAGAGAAFASATAGHFCRWWEGEESGDSDDDDDDAPSDEELEGMLFAQAGYWVSHNTNISGNTRQAGPHQLVVDTYGY